MQRRLLLIAIGLLTASSAMAQLNATGSISFSQNAGVYTYNITLNNTGTTNIGTLWYSWVPGEDFMPVAPSGTSGPSGWTPAVTHFGLSDGWAVQWIASTPLAAGSSLSGFQFMSTATPAELAGNSVFFPTTPVGTSFVYVGAPFGDPGHQLVINPVPEPASLGVLGLGLAFLRKRRPGRK
jgi:hypothetical protein